MKQAITYKINANGITMYTYPNIHYNFDILDIIALKQGRGLHIRGGLSEPGHPLLL